MNASAASRLALRDDMTIYQAQAQKEQLLAALAATPHLELDLSGVGEMDTAGLQLLLLLKREGVQQGDPPNCEADQAAGRASVDIRRMVAPPS